MIPTNGVGILSETEFGFAMIRGKRDANFQGTQASPNNISTTSLGRCVRSRDRLLQAAPDGSFQPKSLSEPYPLSLSALEALYNQPYDSQYFGYAHHAGSHGQLHSCLFGSLAFPAHASLRRVVPCSSAHSGSTPAICHNESSKHRKGIFTATGPPCSRSFRRTSSSLSNAASSASLLRDPIRSMVHAMY